MEAEVPMTAETLFWFWVILGALVGAAIGQKKTRVGAGIFFGLILGPMGWLIVAVGRGRSACVFLLAVPIPLLLTLAGCRKAPPPSPPAPPMVKRPAVDQKKMDPLYRAAKSIQASQTVGVNYQKFGELMQAFATEISIAKDRASSQKEQQLVTSYAAALVTLHDSGVLRKEQIDDSRYNFIPAGRIFVEQSLAPIVAKYSLAKKTHKGYGRPWESISADSIQILWSKASEQIDAANKLFYEEESVPQAPGAQRSPSP